MWSSSSSDQRCQIALDINEATRAQHIHLNRYITSLLPLALPPYTTSPLAYAEGFRVFSGFFVAFEQIWSEAISQSALSQASTDGTEDRLLVALAALRPASIHRTARIRHDRKHLQRIVRRTPPATSKIQVQHCPAPADHPETTASDHAPDTIQDENPIAARKTLILQNPHLLVAYAWVLYMAVFSGGRWIRERLLEAGPQFWTASAQHPSRDAAVTPAAHAAAQGLSFWFFDEEEEQNETISNSTSPYITPHHPTTNQCPVSHRTRPLSDYGHIPPPSKATSPTKSAFLARLATLDALLNPKQRTEIIQEACWIFNACLLQVRSLETHFAVPDSPATQSLVHRQDAVSKEGLDVVDLKALQTIDATSKVSRIENRIRTNLARLQWRFVGCMFGAWVLLWGARAWIY